MAIEVGDEPASPDSDAAGVKIPSAPMIHSLMRSVLLELWKRLEADAAKANLSNGSTAAAVTFMPVFARKPVKASAPLVTSTRYVLPLWPLAKIATLPDGSKTIEVGAVMNESGYPCASTVTPTGSAVRAPLLGFTAYPSTVVPV